MNFYDSKIINLGSAGGWSSGHKTVYTAACSRRFKTQHIQQDFTFFITVIPLQRSVLFNLKGKDFHYVGMEMLMQLIFCKTCFASCKFISVLKQLDVIAMHAVCGRFQNAQIAHCWKWSTTYIAVIDLARVSCVGSTPQSSHTYAQQCTRPPWEKVRLHNH